MRDMDWQDLFYSWDQLNKIVARNAVLLVGDDDTGEVCDYFLPLGNGRSKLQAVFWLAKEMGMLAKPDLLFEVLERVEVDEKALYNQFSLKKRSGGFREICAPDRDLKKIQRRLNKLFSLTFARHKNVSGFSGGSIIEAIQPHLGAKVILGVDCKDAFTTVKAEDLLELYLEGRKYRVYYDEEGNRKEELGSSHFSWYAARFLIKLVTFEGHLPQGAPTSPRLFDLAFSVVDRKLTILAENVGGAYTRYADNVFFSLTHKDCFDKPLVRAILRAITGKRRSVLKFQYHKLRVVKPENKALRLLGLNVIDGRIHNIRSFKRQLRLMIHHVSWLADKDMDFETEWEQLRGMMQFAQTATLPPKLVEDYKKLEAALS